MRLGRISVLCSVAQPFTTFVLKTRKDSKDDHETNMP